MRNKLLPYLFLASLFCILLFILGTRYGQRIEQINNTITSISATPSPLPPTTAPLSFFSYKNATCGASLLLPSQLIQTQQSSISAIFSTENKKLAIALSCEKQSFIQHKDEKKVQLNTLPAFETATTDTISYRLYNAKNAYIITLTTTKEFLPLLQRTFEINKP